jgi:hypothetical protein
MSSVCPCCLLAGVLIVASFTQTSTPAPQTYKGLEVSVASVTRATNVSLSDCPQGANTQRGVIKPGDTTEFASVKADFKVLPSFKPGVLAKPTLTDATGKVYNTAQSFGDISSSTPAFSCTFSFRVPKGTKVTKFAIDTATFDLGAMGQSGADAPR